MFALLIKANHYFLLKSTIQAYALCSKVQFITQTEGSSKVMIKAQALVSENMTVGIFVDTFYAAVDHDKALWKIATKVCCV